MRKLKKVRLMMMTLLMLISQLMAKLMLVAFWTVIIVHVLTLIYFDFSLFVYIYSKLTVFVIH